MSSIPPARFFSQSGKPSTESRSGTQATGKFEVCKEFFTDFLLLSTALFPGQIGPLSTLRLLGWRSDSGAENPCQTNSFSDLPDILDTQKQVVKMVNLRLSG
jgi:hypothetical protein